MSAIMLSLLASASAQTNHAAAVSPPGVAQARGGQDGWRVRLAMARLWRDAVNSRGGDVTVVHLPEIAIQGNTHFPFPDLNNVRIADELSAFFSAKKLA